MAEIKPITSNLRQPIESDLILAVRMVVRAWAVGLHIEPIGSMLSHGRADRPSPSGVELHHSSEAAAADRACLIASADGKGMWPDADPEPVEVAATSRLDG